MNNRYLGWGLPMVVLVASLVGACGGGVNQATGGGAGDGACGSSGDACSSDQFCDYEYNWCGHVSEGEDSAECRPRTTTCNADVKVCGCDGKVYDSECAAYMAGTDIGSCTSDLTPQGTFPCGPYFCDASTSYCAYGAGDQGDRTTECTPLPASCGGVATCDCVPPPDEGKCEMIPGNGVTGIQVTTVWL